MHSTSIHRKGSEYAHVLCSNTFPFPEIMYDDSLTFSVQTFVLGMLFHDQAFAAEHLTTPEALSRLTIPKGLNQLPLPLKKSLDDIPVFRKAIRTLYGWKISEKERLPYHTLLAIMKALGVITGFEQICRPYSLRYNGGKEMNENGKLRSACRLAVELTQRHRKCLGRDAEPGYGAC